MNIFAVIQIFSSCIDDENKCPNANNMVDQPSPSVKRALGTPMFILMCRYIFNDFMELNFERM